MVGICDLRIHLIKIPRPGFRHSPVRAGLVLVFWGRASALQSCNKQPPPLEPRPRVFTERRRPAELPVNVRTRRVGRGQLPQPYNGNSLFEPGELRLVPGDPQGNERHNIAWTQWCFSLTNYGLGEMIGLRFQSRLKSYIVVWGK